MLKNLSQLASPSAWQWRDSFSLNNNRNTQKLHLIFTTKHFLSFFVRLSSFFPHRLFTNSEYYRDIKKTTTNFFDRFFSYFPLSKPTSGRFLFCIASQSRYCVDFMTWFFYPLTARRLRPLRWKMNCVCYLLDRAS